MKPNSSGDATRVHDGTLVRPSPAPVSAASSSLAPSGAPSADTPPADATLQRQLGTFSRRVETRPPSTQGLELRGRYVLEELIGQGAMGQVWRARDRLSEEARDQNPYVAVKILNSDLESHPDGFIAMHREASRAQKLAHPNIVTVHVFDRDDASGRAFIAMELLEGEPLDRVIRGAPVGGMPRAEVLPIIRGMAEGLAYAHRKGFVHCDFKPGNVFLTRDGVPKILDFGIARAVRMADKAGAASDDSSFQGYTPSYAAPEMIEQREPETSDDVFALGLVAYELLTGRHPFGRQPADQARAAQLRVEPVRGLRRREWKALEKALAFERAARWPDAATFLKEFYGRPAVWKALTAAIVVLGLAAGWLWYRNYLETRPAVPFESLPPPVQQQFRDDVRSGRESLGYLERTHDVSASADAAEYFAAAYALHPRNPEAVRGLEAAADQAVAWYRKLDDRRMALDQLKAFQAKSPYYAKYAPVVSAIRDLQSGQ